MKLKKLALTASTLLLGSLFTQSALAEGRLTVYCSATNELCEQEVQAFGKKYDVKVSFVRNGSGSTLAKIEAEKITLRRMFGTAVRLIRIHKRQKWAC